MAAIFKCDTCGNDTEPYPHTENGKTTCMKCLKQRWLDASPAEKRAWDKDSEPNPPATPPEMSTKANVIMVSVVFASLALLFQCMIGLGHYQSTPSRPVQQQQQAQETQWTEGGALHKATGKEWQAANGANRLATAGDFVAAQKERLKRPFTTVAELRAMSVEMEACITEATKPPGDTQKVSEMAVACIITMGWLK